MRQRENREGAPHVALPDGRLILDLWGRGLVLLRTDETLDVGVFERAAESKSLPLRCETVPEAAVAYAGSLVLVRPDGFVAWRGDRVTMNPDAVLDPIRVI